MKETKCLCTVTLTNQLLCVQKEHQIKCVIGKINIKNSIVYCFVIINTHVTTFSNSLSVSKLLILYCFYVHVTLPVEFTVTNISITFSLLWNLVFYVDIFVSLKKVRNCFTFDPLYPEVVKLLSTNDRTIAITISKNTETNKQANK